MSLRTRFALGAGAWTAVVACALAAIPIALRSRLPEPLATHFDALGRPDGSMSFWAAVAVPLGVWVVLAAVLLVRASMPGVLERRARRKGLSGLLGGGGGLLISAQAMIVG